MGEVLVILTHHRVEAHGETDSRRVAPFAVGDLAEALRAWPVIVERPPPHGVPPGGVAGDQAQQPVAGLPADPEGRTAGRDRQGAVERLVQVESPSVMGDRAAVEQRPDHLDRLLEQREPLTDGTESEPERLELLLVPAGAETEVEPAVAG